MADQNSESASRVQESSWTRPADVAQQTALAEGRAEALKQRSAARAAAETSAIQDQESAEDLNSAGMENELGRQKSQAQNNQPGAAGQLQEATADLLKQQLKKKFVLWALPALGTAIFWTLIAFLVGLIIFAFASVYMCVEKKGKLSTFWTVTFDGGFAELLNESFSGTCLADTSAAPAQTTDAPAATPATTDASGPPPDETQSGD